MAKRINLAAGGTVVAPWEVEELPDEWLDAAETLMVDVSGMRQGYAQVEEHVAKWRSEYYSRAKGRT